MPACFLGALLLLQSQYFHESSYLVMCSYNFYLVLLSFDRELSKTERDKLGLHSKQSLIYGEISFHAFVKVLSKIPLEKNAKFFDLGSGTGKAVIAARLLFDFETVQGIEIIGSLHEVAVKIHSKFENQSEIQRLRLPLRQNVYQHIGDFLCEDYDWFSDTDVVFINSTCFDEDLMIRITEIAENMPPGSFVITFTKPLISDQFEIKEKCRYDMSWGMATVFIHRKLKHNGTPVEGELNFVREVEVGQKQANGSDEDEGSSSEDDSESLYEDGRSTTTVIPPPILLLRHLL